MRTENWIIPVVLVASALFYAGACFFMESVLLASLAGVFLSVVWWVAVVVVCVAIFFLNRR